LESPYNALQDARSEAVNEPPTDTRAEEYTARLETLEGASWKRWLGVQAPYRWNLRRLDLGFTLDVGCGVGRNLAHIEGRGVGVDHNPHSVAIARERGFEAYLEEEFWGSSHATAEAFDALLFSHVLEHMQFSAASALVGKYLRLLRGSGKLALITPQEAGHRSDPSHVEFTDFETLHRILANHRLRPERSFSFPFPRIVGRIFPFNEFVVVARKDRARVW
jgi:SAM-dependent methyltransferase